MENGQTLVAFSGATNELSIQVEPTVLGKFVSVIDRTFEPTDVPARIYGIFIPQISVTDAIAEVTFTTVALTGFTGGLTPPTVQGAQILKSTEVTCRAQLVWF